MGTVFPDGDFAETFDTQLTLGTASLLGIFFGIVMVCGIFFGFGFSLGRRGLPQAAYANARPTAVAPAAPKTAALPSPPAIAAVARELAPSPTLTAVSTSPAIAHIAKPSAIHPVEPVLEQPRIRLPYAHRIAMPANTYSASAVHEYRPPFDVHRSEGHFNPASLAGMPPSRSLLLVQIAALSRQDDAEVLASALRKRGFAPSIRNGQQDALYHVQLGPFDRSVAYAARQRLIAHGYNAILK